MKKTSYLFLTTLVLAACSKPAPTVNPIMPVHRTGDTTHVLLTDYLPGISDGEMDLIGNTLEVISVEDHDIVVLPLLPLDPAMYTLSGEDRQFTVAFTHPVAELSIIAMLGDQQLHSVQLSEDGQQFTVSIPECPRGRSFVRVYAADADVLFNDLLIPLQDGKIVTCAQQLNRHDDQAQVLYSLMIDRFCNGNTANDHKLHRDDVLDIVDYQGGDLAGITRKIRDGFFDELGVNTIWISPITQNPDDAWGLYQFANGNKYDSTKTFTRFSGYHGYWPIYNTALDHRFGTPAELHELLATAHKHNINVVLDYVANHLHIASPTLKAHPDWQTDSILPDGRRNFELWDEARLTTWFDVHIPSLDLEREPVYEAMTDTALYWLENYEFDGFRHDACKHIPEIYWRTLGKKIHQRYSDRHIWMIGETYGSPELIGSYVKTGMLNAQFDFNLYYSATRQLLDGGDLCDVDATVRTSLAAYGAHHTMGNISGNHDQVRYASLAGGAITTEEDSKEAGWTREVGIGDSAVAYRRALMLEMINLTIPGVPCIYQGDEYAEVGANDPDNRHMMRFAGLNPAEQNFRQQVETLIHLRRSSMPLLYGDYLPLEANADLLRFRRIYMGHTAEVCIARHGECYIDIDSERAFTIPAE